MNTPIGTVLVAVLSAWTMADPCPVGVDLPGNLGEEALLGTAIAIDGDTAVVGAPLETGHGWASGALYIYRWTVDHWALEERLIADDGDVGDMLGVSVDILGDTVIGGAWFDNDAGSNSGAVYVFVRDAAGVWTQDQKLVMPDAAPEDVFGRTVALAEDFCAVGAPLDDDQGSSSGSVTIFDRGEEGPWTFGTKLLHPGGDDGDQLGLALTVDGGRLLAGAPGAHDGRGEIHLWERLGTWTRTWFMTMETAGSPSDFFGFSVALDGDHMAAGCYRDDTFGTDAGSVWLMSRVFDGWVFEHFPPPTIQAGAQFGVSLSLSGERLLVGSFYGQVDGVAVGTVDVLGLVDWQWSSMGTLAGTDLEAEAEFGWSVAMQGDLALVGALYQPPGGMVFAWEGLVGSCGCAADLNDDGVVGVDDILAVLEAWGAANGDVTGDGVTDVDDILAIIAAWGSC